MYKIFLTAIVFSLVSVSHVMAHSLILDVYSEDEDSITIEGQFDTGASAAGAMVRLESLNTGNILYQKRLPLESELTVAIPDEPYRIVLDGGPGHTTTKEGIPPKNGFSVELKEQPQTKHPQAKGLNLPLSVTFGGAFILLFLTIIVSIRNTRQLLKAVTEGKKR